MGTNINEYVFPGDSIKNIKNKDSVIVIGPGLKRNETDSKKILVTQCGTLRFKSPNTYWIEGLRKKYIPKTGDLVVGVVVKKSGDLLKVDIGASEHASLSMLSFEGATKKQKVDIQVGDVVCSKILNAYKEMEPVLVCVNSYYKAGKLGVLSNEGFLFDLDLSFTHKLLDPEYPLLWSLGKKFVYEIVVGLNGKVWLKARHNKDVLTIVDAIMLASQNKNKDVAQICQKVR